MNLFKKFICTVLRKKKAPTESLHKILTWQSYSVLTHFQGACFLWIIQIRNYHSRSLRPLCTKGTDNSLSKWDVAVPLMHHGQSEESSVIKLIPIIQEELHLTCLKPALFCCIFLITNTCGIQVMAFCNNFSIL